MIRKLNLQKKYLFLNNVLRFNSSFYTESLQFRLFLISKNQIATRYNYLVEELIDFARRILVNNDVGLVLKNY